MEVSRYSAILSLARSGATQRAWDNFVNAGFEQLDSDFDALTLKGRLLKDFARQASGRERGSLFVLAGEAYERAASLRPDSYPLINAAAMALFAGDRVRTELLASKVQNLIESGADKGETPYWGEATRAEALLLLGRTAEAQASLARAMSLAPKAWEDHAATLGQFASILGLKGADREWLDPLRPPPALHFTGILGISLDDHEAVEKIGAAIEALKPGFGYGALAAGADIIAAEALLSVGAELNVILPSDPEEFRKSSVDPFGDTWSQRFDRLMEQADSLTICGQDEPMSAAGVTLAEHHAMGLAIEKAGRLQTKAIALRMEPSDRVSSNDLWVGSGRQLVRVDIQPSAENAATPLPEGELTYQISVDGGASSDITSLDDAVTMLRHAGPQAVVFDCRIGQRSRMATLSARSEPGMLVASRDAALTLLAAGKAARAEIVGEMATNDGPLEICLVTLRDETGPGSAV